jgi:pimeloyl-ACP methyl ester carboxylesterase
MRKLMHTGAGLVDRIDGRLIDRYVDGEVRRILADPVPERFLMGLSHLRWASYLSSPPIDDLREVLCRTLLLHGELDLSTPVESARFVAEVLPQATLKEYAGLDHDFRDERGRDHLPAALDAALAWIFRN